MCLIDFFPAIDFTVSYRASQQPSIPTKMCIDDVKTKYVLTAIRFQSFSRRIYTISYVQLVMLLRESMKAEKHNKKKHRNSRVWQWGKYK